MDRLRREGVVKHREGALLAALKLWRSVCRSRVYACPLLQPPTLQHSHRPPPTPAAVEDVLRRCDRAHYVGSIPQAYAYQDAPLPIGYHETISAPHMWGMKGGSGVQCCWGRCSACAVRLPAAADAV